MADDRDDQVRLAQRIEAARGLLPQVRTGEELDRLGEDALLQKIGGEPGPARLDVRLHGAGIINHRVPVRRATAVLGSLQETVTAIAQALSSSGPTARGLVARAIQDATQMTLSPAISAGSVVFHLSESLLDEPLLLPPDTPSLLDAAVSGLLDVVSSGERGSTPGDLPPLAGRLRRLGPRTAKHLNDLVDRVVSDTIDVELTWRGTAPARTEDLTHERASVLRAAISSNQQEINVVTVQGRLQTVSTVTSADLVAEDGTRYKIVVPAELRSALGRFYDERVEVKLREVVSWSTSTGHEKKTYDLITVGRPGSPPEDALGIDQASVTPRPT